MNLSIKEAIQADLNQNITPGRLKHIEGTVLAAKNLAVLNGISEEDAEIAALLHDNAKYSDHSALLKMCGVADCQKYSLSLEYAPVLHAFAGAARAEEMYPNLNPAIYDAVRFHTTGRPGMSKLEEIIFTADYIEPGREDFPGLKNARQWAEKDLSYCVFVILKQTLEHLTENNMSIHPLTKDAYRYYSNLYEGKYNEENH